MISRQGIQLPGWKLQKTPELCCAEPDVVLLRLNLILASKFPDVGI